ncbi:hypothetical protein P22_2921 [Propionispora sp. 2/2-37]|uniref:PucR family transcriptional regulator n=1 Tax=Propionispora sp. 2/2-37 TaxID=1677858 RepID=UPI0006BB64FC|nr:PucR family transcriptional regulator [Propionispora sp. 2/2-37]CUH96810.1 hypothetical protein P22_2921 [Propionispora sp. 2/2-37]
MRVKDLLRLPAVNRFKLIAGRAGLENPVYWVHISDLPDAAQWLQRGELLFITGMGLKNGNEDMQVLIRDAAMKKLSGLVINIGPYIREIPQEVIQLADALSFPVFTLPWQIKLAGVTKDICAYIVERQMEEKSIREVFEHVLYGDTQNLDIPVTRAAYYGYDLTRPQQVLLIRFEEAAVYWDGAGLKNEENINAVKLNIQRMIDKVLAAYDKKVFFDIRLDSVVMVLPGEDSPAGQQTTDRIARALQAGLQQSVPGMVVCIGVGAVRETPRQIRQSLEQAKFALELARVLPAEEHIYWYSRMGLYKLLFKMDRKELEDYCDEVLSGLINHDRQHEGELLVTLEKVLETGESLDTIAHALFVHRNTLKNRIRKIETITGCKLNQPKDQVKLELALLARKFLN